MYVYSKFTNSFIVSIKNLIYLYIYNFMYMLILLLYLYDIKKHFFVKDNEIYNMPFYFIVYFLIRPTFLKIGISILFISPSSNSLNPLQNSFPSSLIFLYLFNKFVLLLAYGILSLLK